MNALFAAWRQQERRYAQGSASRRPPQGADRDARREPAGHFAGKPLIDPYDVYQHLMDYWAETMQDDC